MPRTLDVRAFGAVGNGKTNDQGAFDAATEEIRGARGGLLEIPPGVYAINQLRMCRNMTVIGAGWSSQLRQRTFDGHLVVLDSPEVEYTRLSSLWLDGNKRGQTTPNDCVSYDNNGASFGFGDPVHRLDDLLLYNPKRHGLTLSADCRETRASNVYVNGADGYGYHLSGTDCFYVNCTSGGSGGHGFYALGNNSKFTNCKAFGSGRRTAASDGFHIRQSHQGLVNCEAQDNARHGFTVADTEHVTLAACVADTNGAREWGMGFRVDNSDGVMLEGALAYNRDGRTSQKYGLSLERATNVHATLRSDNADGDVTGTTVGAHLVVNGRQILTSPSGRCYGLTVGDDGALITGAI